MNGNKEKCKYKVTIVLVDGTILTEYKEYQFDNYYNELNDTRNSFITIGDTSVNKISINFIKVTENEDYKGKEEII